MLSVPVNQLDWELPLAVRQTPTHLNLHRGKRLESVQETVLYCSPVLESDRLRVACASGILRDSEQSSDIGPSSCEPGPDLAVFIHSLVREKTITSRNDALDLR